MTAALVSNPQRLWLVLAFGDDRQYAGNTGYDDDLRERYQYDSLVPNYLQLSKGDVVVIRDGGQMQGIAGIDPIDANGRYVEDMFFDLFCEQLVEAGELEAADRAPYLSARGVRIDGYGGAPDPSEGTLSLIIADFNQSPQIETLTATDMEAFFKRATSFLTKSLDPSFRNSLEETSPGFGLADLIASTWNGTKKVRVFLISNRVLSTRVDGRPAGELSGRPVVYNVWDLGRLQRYVSSSRTREDLVVEMADHGGSLAALPAHLTDAGYEAYLLVVPGAQLASIYDRWGARLLEQNVRVFLQARGNVNKGIRNTIENHPEMFFAYNNGITATAEEVIADHSRGGLRVTALRNLQIVNGGQTTASIYAASRRKEIDLGKVFVQVKLSVIPPERAETVVPRISEYANSQNKVNAADFFANHPFHLRMKDFSQRLFARSADGTFRESKWFYERARGQYQDARSTLSAAERKKFDLEYPKSQVFSKTDLAKFLTLWQGHPDIVSKGAQKNFAYFAGFIGQAWVEKPDAFNEAYYRQAIAKAIVFRETEALVTRQPWYEGGYRANIVAYAIAKVAYDVEQTGRSVNFEGIWRAQRLSDSYREALTLAAEAAKDVIVDPPIGQVKNVTEWAKVSACWDRVSQLHISWPPQWLEELLSGEQQEDLERSAVKEQRMLNGIEAQSAVVVAGADVWRQLSEWGAHRKLLSQKELDILKIAASMPRKLPSEKQCMVVMKLLKKLRAEGCPLAPTLG